jgi:hypothetical protein
MGTNIGGSGTHVDSVQAGVERYLTIMQLHDLLYEHTVYQPPFELVEQELVRCQDVTLLIGMWIITNIHPGNPTLVDWRRIGGHYVTTAGINSAELLIGFSDPDADNFEDGVSSGILRGINHQHGGVPFRNPAYNHGPHFDGVSASHDIYDVVTTPCSPGGIWELEHPYWTDFNTALHYEYQNGGSIMLPGVPWNPACPDQPLPGVIYAEIEAAVIVSPYDLNPDINVIPDSLFHSQNVNVAITYTNDFEINNSGTATLTYSASNTLPWITLGGISGSIPVGGTDNINVPVNTSGIAVGIYVDSVTINSNDPDMPILNKPKIVIQVTSEGNVCDAVPGDANGSGVFNGIDVTFSVNYLKGIGPIPPDTCTCPPWGSIRAAADANGSCAFNGIDVTYSVNYLKGLGGPPILCRDCPTLDVSRGNKPQNKDMKLSK